MKCHWQSICSAFILMLLSATVLAQDVTKEDASLVNGNNAVSTNVLKMLVGSWEGVCRTWFEPGKLADESRVVGTFSPILGGHFIRHEYEGTILGKPRRGEETLVLNSVTNRLEMAWVDDFHMNYGIMISRGEVTGQGFVVSGKYDVAPDTPPWGWKTVLDISDNDHIVMIAYNISPDGQEAKAIETLYTRIKD